MAEVAAYLTDHVLPHLPLRQWVLSLPKRLRPYLHRDPEVAGAVLRIFLRALRTCLRSASPGAPRDGQFAAVSFPQRFGGSLNPHYHFHVLALDGVFSEQPEGPEGPEGRLRFHEATLLTPEQWGELERTVRRRVLRSFRRHGLLDEHTATDMPGHPPKAGRAGQRRVSFAEPADTNSGLRNGLGRRVQRGRLRARRG